MAVISDIRVTISGDAEAALSFRSLLDVLNASAPAMELVAEHLCDNVGCGAAHCLDLCDDCIDLFCREAVDHSTAGAGELETIELNPGNRYLVLCSAIARAGHANSICVGHGWPILSLVGRSASVTKAGGAANPVGGGAA